MSACVCHVYILIYYILNDRHRLICQREFSKQNTNRKKSSSYHHSVLCFIANVCSLLLLLFLLSLWLFVASIPSVVRMRA